MRVRKILSHKGLLAEAAKNLIIAFQYFMMARNCTPEFFQRTIPALFWAWYFGNFRFIPLLGSVYFWDVHHFQAFKVVDYQIFGWFYICLVTILQKPQTPSLDDNINDEVYGEFISLAAGCAPVVCIGHRTAMTSFPGAQHVFLTGWQYFYAICSPPFNIKNFSEKFCSKRQIIGDCYISWCLSNTFFNAYAVLGRKKIRTVRCVLVLVAEVCSYPASDSISHFTVGTPVMISFTTMWTEALTVFGKLCCGGTFKNWGRDWTQNSESWWQTIGLYCPLLYLSKETLIVLICFEH